MAEHVAPALAPPQAPPRWLIIVLILGLYLTLRGYHSRDNDQAYRLPLLLHQQHPALFADDPFVRSFDAFNPHRGYLALLDMASRPLGLSAGLFLLFTLTFAATCIGFDRLARAVWPEKRQVVGLAAIGLALTAKAGNIGTVHLFEAILLDRLIGFALGWLALAWMVERPASSAGRAALAIGLAAVVHPSVGLQLALLLGASWIAWALAPRLTGVDRWQAVRALAALGLALLPWGVLYLGQAPRLQAGLPPEEFRLLSAELQNPQHMLPHLWRLPQWLAFGCYPILALLALGRRRMPAGAAPERATWPAARTRLAIVLAVNLAGLGMAWLGVEGLQSLAVTLFQPFRMATVFRGLALIAVAGRVVGLWRDGRFVDRARAVLIAIGLAGDRMLVVATAVDLAVSGLEYARTALRMKTWAWHPAWTGGSFAIALGMGLVFLARHDPEQGPWFMVAAVAALAALPRLVRGRTWSWNRRRLAWALALAWAVPLAAFLAANLADPRAPWAEGLIEPLPVRGGPHRRHRTARTLVPGTYPRHGPVHRPARSQDLPALVAPQPGVQPGGEPLPCRRTGRLGRPVPRPRRLRRLLRCARPGLSARPPRPRGSLSSDERSPARRPGGPARGRLRRRRPATAGRARPAGVGSPLELLHVEGRYAVYRVRTPAPPAQLRTAARSAGTG